ncbi:MAG TPA: hypothetical protein VJN44_18100, partial [Roseateles sp.]|nr:hypothetical protein [Roseateles sp.]
MRGRIALAGLAAAAVLLPPRGAGADEPAPMRWQVRDMPPHFIYAGGRPPARVEDLGGGTIDSYMRQLLPLLPQYRHAFVEATAARAQAITREGKTLCSLIHLYTPERLAERYFSPAYPVLGTLQAQVVVHRSQLPRFAALGQPLSLAQLLQRSDLSGMMTAGRSFGASVDRLLRARRMDYALEFPGLLDEYLRNVDAPGELVGLPMAEASAIALTYVSCTRNEEGRQQIEAIDQAI